MKKYIIFIIFYALLGLSTSIFLNTDFAQKFYSNNDDDYSSIKWGDKLEFGTILKGKLYFFDDGSISFSGKNSQQHYINIYYCKTTQCMGYNENRIIQSINEIAKRENDFDKTNEVSVRIPSYEEIFGDYELSYKGWEVQMIPDGNTTNDCFNLMLIPDKDESNKCLELENFTIEWYKYYDVDLSNINCHKENIGKESIGESKTIEFQANSNDKLVINMQSNVDIIFYIDNKRVATKMYITSNTYKYKDYVNYEFNIKSSGKHKLTMVFKPSNDESISIEHMRVLSLINTGMFLEKDSLKDGERILERYGCDNNYNYESIGVYTKR